MNVRSIWELMERMQGDIAAEIRVMLDESAYSQAMFDDTQRDRRIMAMKKCAVESTSDTDRHDSWMKMHIDDGWVYGENFDPAAKTHPNLKPWGELPPSVKSKARIFDIVAKAAGALESLTTADDGMSESAG